jgi:hypothetical protein
MYYYYNQDTNTSTKLCTVNSLLFMICQFSWIILKHEIIRIQRIFNTVYTCTEYSMGSYQLSWISWIVTNHEIKNSTIFWHHIHITEYSMGWYQLSWISWIVSHNEIKNSTNICTNCYSESTNLCIHENAILPETTKVWIHDFKWIHIICLGTHFDVSGFSLRIKKSLRNICEFSPTIWL